MLRRTILLTTLFISLAASPAIGGDIVIDAVGDIMLAGSGSATFKRLGYFYPFAAVASELRSADIAVGNLEAPLARGGTEFVDKKFRFKVAPAAAPALKQAGFSVLTLANNHMMDFGPEALQETLHHLDEVGVLHTGAGTTLSAGRKSAIIEIRGKKVAFIAYSITLPEEFYATATQPGTVPGYPAYYVQDIARAKSAADYVVVSFHWGSELAVYPNQHQVNTAHRAVEAGADVVIGHHPHVLQGIERYQGKLILYSLGNFAFGTTSRVSDRSVIARITLRDGGEELELIPVNVLNGEVRYQPRILRGARGMEVVDRLQRLSERFGTRLRTENGRYFLDRDDRLAKR